MVLQMGFRDRVATVFRSFSDRPEAKTVMQATQFASTLLFVVLYIWSTYSPPPLWSIRYNLDLFLCLMFAVDYVSRFWVRDLTPTCNIVLSLVLRLNNKNPACIHSALPHGHACRLPACERTQNLTCYAPVYALPALLAAEPILLLVLLWSCWH